MRLPALLLAFLAPFSAVATECATKEQMTLKVEYEGTANMVDEAKAAAGKAQDTVAAAVKDAKLKPLSLKSAKLMLEPGDKGMTYRGSSIYQLPSSLHVRELMAALAGKNLSPSVSINQSSRCEKDE